MIPKTGDGAGASVFGERTLSSSSGIGAGRSDAEGVKGNGSLPFLIGAEIVREGE